MSYLDHPTTTQPENQCTSTGSGNLVLAVPYDRFALSADDEVWLRTMALSINSRHREIFSQIVATGRDLLAAKKLLGHGKFGEWLKVEFRSWGDRTAQNYMALATSVDQLTPEETATVSVLPLRALYLFASRSTPSNVRANVLSRISAGEIIDETEIRRLRRSAASSTSPEPVPPEEEFAVESSPSPVAEQRSDAPGARTKGTPLSPQVRTAAKANLRRLEQIYAEASDREVIRDLVDQSSTAEGRQAIMASIICFAKHIAGCLPAA